MPKNNEDKIIQLHLVREINRLKQKGILDEQKYKGKDGISITNIYLQGRNLIIETSDKKKHNVGPIVGLDGKDGISIKEFKLRKKDLIITTSDGKKHNVGKVVGDDGAPGLDGFTPERGVDYFTEEDIQKFVTNVIAALPEGKIEDLARDLEKLDGLARLSFNALRDVPEHLTEDGIKNLARKVTHLAAGASPTYKLDSVFVGRGKTLNIVGSGITASKSGDTITYDFSSLSGGGSGDAIVDADNDTKVEVEQSPDEDVIRGTVAGTEKFYVDDRYLVSTDTFRDAFGPIRNQESNQYLTSVYNSSGFGGASLGDIKMSTSNISIFDLSTIPSIPHSDGFHGALTDGRYIYLIPRRDSSSNQHGIIVRYDTTKPHTSASSYDYFDLETLNANCKSFIGGAYHSGYIYLANNDYGENVRYNVELPFDDSASWEVFDTEDIAAGVKGYQGIVATPTHLYYIPYSNGSAHGQLTRFDVTGDFTNSSNWEYFDMTTVDADAKGFAGGVFDGRYVYLAGFNNPSRETTIRYDTLADFSTSGSYTSFETTDINANARGYIGMSFDGRYVYYSPFLGSVAHGLALRFDSQGTFTNTSDWELFDITTVDANAKGYIGMSQDARYVYYTPRGASGGSGLVTRYDKSKTFQSTEAWEIFDLEDIQVGAGGYVGGVAIGDSVYLSPNESTYFPRIIGIGGDPNIPRGAAQILRGTDIHLAPNGFLGIGHNEPDSLMHIKGPGSATVQASGTSLLHLESTTNSYYAEILFTALDSSGGSRSGAIGMDGLTGNDNILYLANGAIQGLVVDKSGHVGRGTQTPTYQLDVEETDESTDSVVSIVHTGNRNAALELENSNNTWRLSSGINTGNIILFDSTNNTLPFQIEPNTPDNAVYVNTSGGVGINTDTIGDGARNTLLHIYGEGTGTSGRTDFIVENTSTDSASSFRLVNSNGNSFSFQLSGPDYSVGEQASVGPTQAIDLVFGTNGNTLSGGSGDIIFRPGGYGDVQKSVWFKPDGNVTIGTDTAVDYITIVKNQNAQTALSIDNGTDGASAFTTFKAINNADNNVRLGITATSANFTNDAFDGGVGFLDTTGAAFNIVSNGSTGDFNFFAGGTSNSDIALHIDGSTGYIGINNNNPTEEVDILSDSNNFTIVSFTNTNAGSSAGAEFRAVNDGDYWFRAGISSQAADATGDVFDGGVGFIDVDGTAFNLLSRGSTGDFNFFSGGVNNSFIKLHIDGSTGYIGMGTSDPQGAWEVSGTSGIKPVIRATTEDTSYNNQLIFATGSGAPDNTNVTGIIKAGITQANPSSLKSYLSFFANTGDTNTEVMRLSENGYVGINETDPDTLVHYTGGALRGEDGTIEICQIDSSQADRITNSATSLPNFITYSSAFDDNAKVGLWVAQSWTSGTVSNANHRNFGLNAFAYLEGSTDASITSSDFNAVGGRYGVRVNDTAQAHSIAGVASYNWHQGSGTVTNSSHFLSEGTAVSVGTGLTITTLAHFRALNIPSVDGTITNQYGIYIPALSNATNNYGAYIEDNVGIGDATPATKLSVEGAITFAELSSDPSNPSEGHTAIWQSDGTGTGDDGDLYFVTTAGATTKKIQITDFSAGTLAGGGGSSTLQQAFDLGQSITIADTDNQTLAITNNDVTNNPDTIDITNAGTNRAIYILQTGDTGNGASTSGAFFLNNTSNPGIGANLYDNGTSLDVSLFFMKLDNTLMDGKVMRIDHDGLGGSLIELNANNASHSDPIIWIKGSGTGGGQADIRMDSPNPDIEFIDTDYTTPDGKYEIDVGPYTGGKSALRMNSRNDADNSFESIAYFFRKGSTGGGMAIEDGVITVGGYDVTASDGYGRILVNSDAVSPSSIDLGNSITVGTGTGGANATAKHLGNFAWMSRDSSFSAPKIVAHISVEATETYAADTDVGSRMVFYTGTDNNTSPTAKMAIEQDGQILLNNYGSGTFTGTTAKWLTVDSSGNVIEEDAPAAESFSLLGRYGTTISMGSGSLFFGLWGNHTTASATYQASYNVPIPIACTLYAISFGTTANTSDDSFDIYPVVNGTRAGSSLTVGTGNTADYVSGLSISLSAGDLLQIEIDRSNPTSGACSNGTIVFYFK